MRYSALQRKNLPHKLTQGRCQPAAEVAHLRGRRMPGDGVNRGRACLGCLRGSHVADPKIAISAPFTCALDRTGRPQVRREETRLQGGDQRSNIVRTKAIRARASPCRSIRRMWTTVLPSRRSTLGADTASRTSAASRWHSDRRVSVRVSFARSASGRNEQCFQLD